MRNRRADVSAERAKVVDALARAFAESRIDMAELEARLDIAQRHEERDILAKLLADLPEGAALAARAASDKPAATAAAAPATAVVGAELVAQADHVVAIFSGTRRQGVRAMPALTQVEAIFGGVELDLREAIWPQGEVIVDCTAVFGGIEVVVPADISVRVEGAGIFGAFDDSASGEVEGARGRLLVRGTAIFGGVSVERPVVEQKHFARLETRPSIPRAGKLGHTSRLSFSPHDQ